MTRKEDLPDTSEGFVVFPRRMAFWTAVGMLAAIAGPSTAFYISDAQQERRILEIERRIQKAEDRAEKDRGDIADMKADIRVIRQIVEGNARRL